MEGISSLVIASATSGTVARLVFYPLDTLRARLQVERGVELYNTTNLLKNILQKEGWKALYKGLGISMIINVPGTVVYLSTYEKTKKGLEDKITNKPLLHLVSGFIAECVSGLLWTPMDVVKQKLQVETTKSAIYKDSRNALRVIYQREGLIGLYRGYFITLSVFAPFSMIYFVVYEKLKATFGYTPVSFFASAGTAGAVAAALTCPLDVVKTRLQVQSKDSHGVMKYNGVFDAFRSIVKKEGWGAFSKGMVARIAWVAPSTAVNLFLFEYIKSYLSPPKL